MTASEVDGPPPLLRVTDLGVTFHTRYGAIQAVDGVSFDLTAGTTLALLGESGSGKSVTARGIMGLLPPPPGVTVAGSVSFQGKELLGLPDTRLRDIRGRHLALVFQDALSSLNPVLTVGDQIAEMYVVHDGLSRRAGRQRAIEMLDLVRIPGARTRIRNYPHEFSGGMRQRVMIAMALALRPEVLVADEPTTALDVTVQAQILRLLRTLQEELGMGLILITHDVDTASWNADRVAVMYAGRIVEQGLLADLRARPAHPYTKGLVSSIPPHDRKVHRLPAIPGQPPNLASIPSGCPFHPRCEWAREHCVAIRPPLLAVDAGRASACHYWDEVLA